MHEVSPEDLFADHLALVSSRTAAALEEAGFDGVVVHAGTAPMVFQDDYPYPFKAHAAFRAWAPLTDAPDAFVAYRPGQRPVLLYPTPDDFWHKTAPLPDAAWVGQFEVRPVRDRSSARDALPDDLGGFAFLGEAAGFEGWGFGAINPQALVAHLDFERARKSPYELACLRGASRLGARGHLAAQRAFFAGASEYAIGLAYLEAMAQREQELPYNPIIALNEGGAVLHYQVQQREAPAERRSMLIDAGASHAGYASDITRTYSYADPDFAALIGGMDDVQQALCAGVRAGTDWRDLHLTAHRLIAELLREADVIACDAEVAVESGLSAVFFPHGLGHLLGLQVHDVGGTQAAPEGGDIPRPSGHPYLRLTRVLEEGFVVTMEPGLYFIDSLLAKARANGEGRHINWERVAQFAPFGGIRIEDDLAVTTSGCENLTRDAFRAVR
jgi:Xaa-Pro dipeptidase